MNIKWAKWLGVLVCLVIAAGGQQAKPKIGFDEFFNSVGFNSVQVSPDGSAVAIATERADWEQEIYRRDLWLYRQGAGLVQLTQSAHDSRPRWSPDGRWIAFLSERKAGVAKDENGDARQKDKEVQLYLISPAGGEAFAVTEGEEGVHTFAWSPDSQALYFATRTPWTKQQNEDYKKQWKDTIQYRASERGDVIFKLDLAEVLRRHAAAGTVEVPESEKDAGQTPGAKVVTRSALRMEQVELSPDGKRLAFVTASLSERQEKVGEFEIFAVELGGAEVPAKQLTHNEAVEQTLKWAPDGRHIYFLVDVGSVEGKYKDTQTRLYSVDSDSSEVQRWGAQFGGAITGYSAMKNGGVLVTGRLGTEVQVYAAAGPAAEFRKLSSWAGTHEFVATAPGAGRVAFVQSSVERPAEVYLAESADELGEAKPITRFNRVFTDRELPQGKPYQWKAEDGTTVEGMLIYPPGKFGQKNLPMFVLIHGGPADADGNSFKADWYQWDRLAAEQGWLVLEPNYRGSSGYGDKFLEQIVPEIVSRPGKDILAGVDALVKDGTANPEHLAIGGYSYGGYMTNWLITQTTRFKAAVTGAGAVEHVGNWGNDDTTFDDAYFLGGLPWEQQERYRDEAAIFQINKARTPTHMVAGADDIRVAVMEDYLLDHALHALSIPSELLIFPGEGHSLTKNPWHGKIKVREELKWLEKYGK